MQQNIVVLKFGSSVLRSVADLHAAVHEIYRWYRDGSRILAVISAMGDTTERLLAQARQLGSTPDAHATAELLATGERVSAALLGIALERVGVPARVVDPREIDLIVSGSPLDSEPASVDSSRLLSMFDEHPVLVLPGFFGHTEDGRLHLLGRGGSDLSAVFVATALRAQRCRLLKDVDGVYESDPAVPGSRPRRFSALAYEDALRVAGPLIQPKAVNYLAASGTAAEVAALALPHESVVHSRPTALADRLPEIPAKRVLILGLGTVGFGVYQRLLAMPQWFAPLGALVRDRAKHEAANVPGDLLHTSEEAVLSLDPDIVVDALPACGVSSRLVVGFLRRGIDVVSANKGLLVDEAAMLADAQRGSGAVLRISAAVGGSAPMIEALRAAAKRGPLIALSGVLNGTCNFMLERCAHGAALMDALAEAQALGFAEADPSEDVSGRDAERKLRILAEVAFGERLLRVKTDPLTDDVAAAAGEASRRGSSLRQVSRVRRSHDGWIGQVSFESMEREHPLAIATGEWNALLLTQNDGRSVRVVGRGAGRWPTTEAVMADLLEAHRENSAALKRRIAFMDGIVRQSCRYMTRAST
jgi:homoserine dehydrogenase